MTRPKSFYWQVARDYIQSRRENYPHLLEEALEHALGCELSEFNDDAAQYKWTVTTVSKKKRAKKRRKKQQRKQGWPEFSRPQRRIVLDEE